MFNIYLSLTAEQKKILTEVKDFAQQEIAPYIDEIDKTDKFPFEIIKKMSENGLLGLPIPIEWGGRGFDFISYILAIQEISKVSATIGVILAVHTSVATLPILNHGTEFQKAKHLKKLAQGDHLGAFALTESSAGSDASQIKTEARFDSGNYILNGSKMFITNAEAADIYITFAVTANGGPGQKQISAFIVEKDMPGLKIAKKEKKMGLNGSNTCELIFENLIVPEENRLGSEGEGYKIALANLAAGRIGIAAQALGIAQAAYDLIRNFVIDKKLLVDLYTKLELAQLFVQKAASEKNNGKSLKISAAMAKMVASDTAVDITSKAIDLLGYEACLSSHPLQRYFRDAKITQIYEGTNEIQRIVIAKELVN